MAKKNYVQIWIIKAMPDIARSIQYVSIECFLDRCLCHSIGDFADEWGIATADEFFLSAERNGSGIAECARSPFRP